MGYVASTMHGSTAAPHTGVAAGFAAGSAMAVLAEELEEEPSAPATETAPSPSAPRREATPAIPVAAPAYRERARVALVASRASAVAPAPADPLVEESGLVLRARRALRAGDSARALAIVDEARARLPEGALVQEREALAIEALALAGRDEEAAARAAAFLREHASSPYATTVRRYAR